MKILVTGANGFIGKNLVVYLKSKGFDDILEFDTVSPRETLAEYTDKCEFVFDLAGVNRPKDEIEFTEGNTGFTSHLLNLLKKSGNKSPILFSSSIQAQSNNPYGESKKACENLILNYGKENGVKTYIYRLPNVFGKWCKPNYNSVVATFCHNIARGLSISVNNRETVLQLAYVGDVAEGFLNALYNQETRGECGFCSIQKIYAIKLGELANKLYAFNESRKTLVMPRLETDFDRKLYSTFISYLPENDFANSLKVKNDERGWLFEFIKSNGMGQIFISNTKPGITRGNHFHHTKAEKFLVIKGEATISLRKLGGNEKIEYRVSGNNPRVVDIPAGYTHSITNIGNDDLITLFWANEIFCDSSPDTFYEKV